MLVRRAAPIAVACGIALAGCGSSDRELVQSKVDQFVRATAHKDYPTLCAQVLAPSLLAHLNGYGIKCEQAMQVGLGGVTDPALAVGRVDVHGSRASVVTISTAKGQQASLDAIELIKTGSGWRVSALGTPTFPKAAQKTAVKQ
jgi:hypothetical protein